MSRFNVELLPDEEEPKRVNGVVTATVITTHDPFMQGRVQVSMHFLDTGDLSSWAKVASIFAGMLSGSYFVPMPGDEVIVAFEQGDVDKPIIIGALRNLTALPPVPSPLTTIKTIRTLTGNQIVFADAPPSVTIQSAAPAAVPATPAAVSNLIVSPDGVKIMCGPTNVLINPAGITLQAGSSTVVISAAGIQIGSGTAPVFVAGSLISLQA